MIPKLLWHTPKKHVLHNDGVPCGCANSDTKNIAVCNCGAMYNWNDVMTFPIFRCYDCGGNVSHNLVEEK